MHLNGASWCLTWEMPPWWQLWVAYYPPILGWSLPRPCLVDFAERVGLLNILSVLDPWWVLTIFLFGWFFFNFWKWGRPYSRSKGFYRFWLSSYWTGFYLPSGRGISKMLVWWVFYETPTSRLERIKDNCNGISTSIFLSSSIIIRFTYKCNSIIKFFA